MKDVMPRQQFLEYILDLVKDLPENWKAVSGNTPDRFGTRKYFGHKDVGALALLEYYKNPFEILGFGMHVSEDFSLLANIAGNYGLILTSINMNKLLDYIKNGACLTHTEDPAIRLSLIGAGIISQETSSELSGKFASDMEEINDDWKKLVERHRIGFEVA